MNYVITGSLGHVSLPVVKKLVASGHKVKVISSNEGRSNEIVTLGATPLIGSVQDAAFLREAFKGADAVYTMVPPTFAAPNWKKYIADVGRNYAAALEGSSVKYVVNLSSVGAHLEQGCGPVSGLYGVEHALNSLSGINVLHIRAGFFYNNLLANIGMVKHMGIIGANYGQATTIPFVHTDDLAEVVANALIERNFNGKSFLYVVSDEKTTDEVASLLGKSIGKPDLKWVDFTDEQSVAGMLQAGLPAEVANNYTEMGSAMRTGAMAADYNSGAHRKVGNIKFSSFAKEFAQLYNN